MDHAVTLFSGEMFHKYGISIKLGSQSETPKASDAHCTKSQPMKSSGKQEWDARKTAAFKATAETAENSPGKVFPMAVEE